MQEIVSPYDPDKTVLYISYNSEASVQKNLFLRKVLISSYANGLNPYLNNEALVCINGEYRKITEWGADFEKLK